MSENFRPSSGGEDEQSSGAPEWLENYFDSDSEESELSDGTKKKKFRKLFKPLFRAVFPRNEKQNIAQDIDSSPKRSLLDMITLDNPRIKESGQDENNRKIDSEFSEKQLVDSSVEEDPLAGSLHDKQQSGYVENSSQGPSQIESEKIPLADEVKNLPESDQVAEIPSAATYEQQLLNAHAARESRLQLEQQVADSGQETIETEIDDDHTVAVSPSPTNIPETSPQSYQAEIQDKEPKPIKGAGAVAGFLASEMMSRRRDRKIQKEQKKQKQEFDDFREHSAFVEQTQEKSLKRLIRRTRKTKPALAEAQQDIKDLQGRTNQTETETGFIKQDLQYQKQKTQNRVAQTPEKKVTLPVPIISQQEVKRASKNVHLDGDKNVQQRSRQEYKRILQEDFELQEIKKQMRDIKSEQNIKQQQEKLELLERARKGEGSLRNFEFDSQDDIQQQLVSGPSKSTRVGDDRDLFAKDKYSSSAAQGVVSNDSPKNYAGKDKSMSSASFQPSLLAISVGLLIGFIIIYMLYM